MGSKKLFTIPVEEGGLNPNLQLKDSPLIVAPAPAPSIIIDNSNLKAGQADYHPAKEICSIIPYAVQESLWLYQQYKNPVFKELAEMFSQSIGLGKWSVNMLVQYKNKYIGWGPGEKGHNELYRRDVNYELEFDIHDEIKKTTETDLSFLGESPNDYAEVNKDDKEYLLFNYMAKANQILKKLENGPIEYDLLNLRRILDGMLMSAYKICHKMKAYTGEFTKEILDVGQYNRKILW
jgi:hypothetical protein